MRIGLAALVLTAAALCASTASAQEYPRQIPSPGGAVIIPSARYERAVEIGYAPARRAGDVLYVSGAIVGRAPDEGTDAAAFESQVRRTLRQLDATVQAAGGTLNDVAMIRSFHVWDGPNFTGTRMEQIEVISKVWAEFSRGPRPAWTAVGTTGLLAPDGIVEIELTVHSPAQAN